MNRTSANRLVICSFIIALAIIGFSGHLTIAAPPPGSSPDSSAVIQSFLAHYPSSTTVKRVAMIESYALLNWRDGEMGGEALLKRENNQWVVVTAGGGALTAEALTSRGVPPEVARQLVQKLEATYK